MSDSPVASGLRPSLQTNRRWLRRAAKRHELELTNSGCQGALDGLEALLAPLVLAVAEPELRAADRSGVAIGLDADDWASRWARFPRARALVELLTAQWRRQLETAFTRLNQDRAGLCRRLGIAALPPISSLKLDAGDRHDDGQTVVLLGFVDGTGLVYKPKDLRVAAAVLELLAILDEAGLEPALGRRWIWTRTGYAWEQRLEHRACDSRDGLRRYYRRLGALARVMQLLGAGDLWLDNLIAVGEQPMFIDLETALSPGRSDPEATFDDPAHAMARYLVDQSVVALAMLSMRVSPGPGLADEELGVLAPPGSFCLPYRVDADLERMAFGEASPHRDGHALWSHRQHAALLAEGEGEVFVDPACFAEEILAGMDEAQRVLLVVRKRISAWLETLAGLPLRVIRRHTWLYGRVLRKLQRPALLADGAASEALFAAWRQAAASSDAALVDAEIAAFRRLDVPYLCVRADGCDLLDGAGAVLVAAAFDESALARARARLAGLA
ncbi:MAG: type 2 lantipeptide synthetase LanM, partial [Myxococcales bacterium]|nr:type 2 lantipeptide synthetase LanM [Myxococcales bacterium]